METAGATGHTVRIMFDESPIGMCSAMADGTILRRNAAFAGVTGAAAGSLLDLVDINSRQELAAKLAAILDGDAANFTLEAALAAVPGRWCELSGVAMRGATGDVMVHVLDVTARRHREEYLRELAERDPLTGLYNRLAFHREVSARLADGPNATVMLLDLDGFKAVNDTGGHQRGDAVLASIATALRDAVPSGAIVARLGGDEFAVLLDLDPREAAALGTRLINRITIAAACVVRTPRVTASVGIAPASRGNQLEGVLASVDRAMYGAKRAGKARCQIALSAA
ncbi:MAG TPA: diguanylate cyclase [Candidatus Elarobacter sp.]